jgi:hypothetical protein
MDGTLPSAPSTCDVDWSDIVLGGIIRSELCDEGICLQRRASSLAHPMIQVEALVGLQGALYAVGGGDRLNLHPSYIRSTPAQGFFIVCVSHTYRSGS